MLEGMPMQEITLYTTNCPRCTVLEQKLKTSGLSYTVENDTNKMIALGLKSAPALSVDGKLMDFPTAFNWLENGRSDN